MKIELGNGLVLPRPGAPHMDNLAATMIVTGNSSATLKDCGLDRIADHQGFDAGEFRARFAELEWIHSQQPTDDFGVEGK